ncbi:uncharacterized protein LOC141659809 [Apium graveolens]|uniref:uncharacterized protein LOC141659809 n=1 Tax=Apium graveolens TaxID=4045 RepID=UPI003D7ADA64
MTSEADLTTGNESNHNDVEYSAIDISFQLISLDSSHPLYLHPSDHPGQVLVAAALTGENFNEWKRSMTLALYVKNKLGFVTGKFKAPGINYPYFNHWKHCNDMIITWLFNSLAPGIRSSLVYVTLAEDELNDDLNNVAQAPKCVCVCTCNAKAQLEKFDDVMKVTQFLMGLNDSYTNIRGQLLMMNPMSKITQALALLQQEERHIGYTAMSSSTVEFVVLATHQAQHNSDRAPGNAKPNQFTRNVSNNSRIVAQVHTVVEETDPNQSNQIALPHTLSSTRYQQLIAMLNQVPSGINYVEPPQSGTCTCSYMSSICLVNGHTSDDWILDSGATDHITCTKNNLTNITPCSVNICLPNGQFALVKHKGTIHLSRHLILYDVLLIPEFHFNLIYIGKLIITLHVEVQFLPTQCLIQDPMNKRVMGIGNLQGNLYKLVLSASGSPSSVSATASSIALNISNGQLWHDILGHTPLTVIKHMSMFPLKLVTQVFYLMMCVILPNKADFLSM